ncbi:MAG: hypothetical protein SGPRY_013099, partial [Prymnesium sp.]
GGRVLPADERGEGGEGGERESGEEGREGRGQSTPRPRLGEESAHPADDDDDIFVRDEEERAEGGDEKEGEGEGQEEARPANRGDGEDSEMGGEQAEDGRDGSEGEDDEDEAGEEGDEGEEEEEEEEGFAEEDTSRKRRKRVEELDDDGAIPSSATRSAPMDPADECVLIEQLTAAAHALLLGSDIALIEENTGRAFSRQKQSFRRLSKKARGSSTVEFRASGDAEEVGKQLEDRLFDDQDVEEDEDDERDREISEEIGDDDEEDFIDDGPGARPARRRREGGVSAEMAEMLEEQEGIFGSAAEMQELLAFTKGLPDDSRDVEQAEDYGEEDESDDDGFIVDDADEDEDEEEREARKAAKRAKKR